MNGANEPTLTPLQRKALNVLADAGGTHLANNLADKIAPRPHGWKPQGSVRWCAAYFKALEDKGLVKRFLKPSGAGGFSHFAIMLTPDGWAMTGKMI